MKLADQIKPISYLKAHAAEIVRNLREKRNPLIITQNGEARVVIQDIESYEQTQETMALLKILALGNRQIENGNVEPAIRCHQTASSKPEKSLMSFEVLMTEDAARDLEEIYRYIAQHDTPNRADHVLEKIEEAIIGLSESPVRGVYPKELATLGIREYHEIFFKPYRIIYRVMRSNVYILLIADGRRDMQTLLSRRLLGY